MLKYPCLVLDHDDTVVQSEATVNYPFFVEFLKEYRPGMTITLHEYISLCYEPGYVPMCKERFSFSDEELLFEYNSWKEHIRSHIPAPYPGIERIVQRQKEEGGIICVVSQSSQENISRDYAAHFGVQPDMIFGWDLEPEHRKPSPWALEQIMKTYNLSPAQLLVIDDMKAAVGMARAGGCPVAFAGWGRTAFPKIFEEMSSYCDFTFDSTEKLYKFLFE
ncbi:MAG: HAD family phosphatase [Oscillospiraceae bacterium]|nr:HAD family phosphatase [Oscillospiraceae bacterium]